MMKNWKHWMSAVIGLWFLISPWVLQFSQQVAATWTSVVIGALQLIVSVWAALLKEQTANTRMWLASMALVTGLWFVIQPFVFAQDQVTTWVTAVLGAVTALVNLWALLEERGDSGAKGSRPQAA